MKRNLFYALPGFLILTSLGAEIGGGLTSNALAQEKGKLELLSRLPLGNPWAIEVLKKGDKTYAILGETGYIRVLDVTDPSQPQQVGEVLFLPDAVTDLEVIGDYLLVANRGGGLRQVDISDISSLKTTRLLTEDLADCIYIDQQTQRAYIGITHGRILVFDIANPEMIFQLPGGYPDFAYPLTICGKGEYIYVGGVKENFSADAGFSILKISNDSLSEVKYISVREKGESGYPAEMIVRDNFLLIAMGAAGFWIMDISDPENPVKIGEYKPSDPNLQKTGYGLTLCDSGNIVFFADGIRGVEAFDISNPTNPVLKASYWTGKNYIWAERVLYFEGNVYSVGSSWGLRILNKDLNLIGYYNTGGTIYKTYYNKSLMVHTFIGLWKVDISEPASPQILDFWEPENIPWIFDFQDETSYAIAATEDSLKILDFSTFPPTRIGDTDLYYHQPKKIVISGNYAYIISWEGEWVEVFDISNSQPERVGIFLSPSGKPISDITISGHWMFLRSNKTLFQIDISDPNPHNFRVQDTYETDNNFYSDYWDKVVAKDSLVAVNEARISGDFVVADVEVLKATNNGLIPVGYYAFPYGSGASCESVYIEGDYIFLAIDYVGLKVLKLGIEDSSNTYSKNMAPVAASSRLRGGGEIFVKNGLIVLTVPSLSVSLLKFTPPTPVEPDHRHPSIPQNFSLSQNYPNPFNSITWIEFAVKPPARQVKLVIYNSLGQKIRTLVDRFIEPGYYRVDWDGRDEQGEEVVSGIYYYQLRLGKHTVKGRKMLLLR